MKICFVSSEVVPFAKTGGLADVSGALPKYIARHGHDVRVFMPFYSSIDVSRIELHVVDFIRDVPVRFGGETITFTALSGRMPGSEVDIYFIDCPRLYGRGSVYTDDPDEYLRFAFLSRAVIECCQRMGWGPDIFHCHDWQTALIPLLLRTIYEWDRLFAGTRTMLTIHNIAYQGVFPASVIDRLGMSEYRNRFYREDLAADVVNYMKTGILYADVLSTVSITYAREIQTSENGAGLDTLLRMRSNALFGIVNGVDYNEWSPETDTLIPAHYSAEDLSGKEICRQELLASMGLDDDPAAPVLGIVSRLTGQKGVDLLMESLPPIIGSTNVRLVVLGSGEPKYEEFFTRLAAGFPGRVGFYRGFQNRLSHMIEAGSDIFLMPSHFEPCGLNQIYSLRYGTIPVVRRTGGLADTVQQFDPATGDGTGFVFQDYDAVSLRGATEAAIRAWHDHPTWRRLMENAMRRNYSWEVQVERYLELYRALVEVRSYSV